MIVGLIKETLMAMFMFVALFAIIGGILLFGCAMTILCGAIYMVLKPLGIVGGILAFFITFFITTFIIITAMRYLEM